MGGLKNDLMAMFVDFHSDELQLFSLNFGTIILLPKCKEAVKIQQFRPICLLNVSFKKFTKVLTNRLISVAKKVNKSVADRIFAREEHHGGDSRFTRNLTRVA